LAHLTLKQVTETHQNALKTSHTLTRARGVSLVFVCVWFFWTLTFLGLDLRPKKKKGEEDHRCSPMAINRIAHGSLFLTVVLFFLTVNYGEAIWLTIPTTGGTKCVSEEIQSNVVVLADYYVVDEHNPENTPAVSSKVRFLLCLELNRFKIESFVGD